MAVLFSSQSRWVILSEINRLENWTSPALIIDGDENEKIEIYRAADRILPINARIARLCAKFHVPDPRPESDALIAATAVEHGLTIVTRNIADFEPMGVAIPNPWIVN